MGILDKLLEKKDARIYLELRLDYLRKIDITQYPEKKRALMRERIEGRKRELSLLLRLLHQNRIKSSAIDLWRNREEDQQKKIAQFQADSMPMIEEEDDAQIDFEKIRKDLLEDMYNEDR